MKFLILMASLAVVSPTAAFAHHYQQARETCRASRFTETYRPGHYLQNGTWVAGRVVHDQISIPCTPSGVAVQVSPHNANSLGLMPQHQTQHVLVNNESTAPQLQSCRGVVTRMGLGGILGGVAGRYAVGGKKSKHTVLGTTIGAAAGSLIGRATC
jgi:hypothetical protein